MNSRSKNQSQGIDFVTPLVEIIHHFAVLIGTLGLDVLKYAWPDGISFHTK